MYIVQQKIFLMFMFWPNLADNYTPNHTSLDTKRFLNQIKSSTRCYIFIVVNSIQNVFEKDACEIHIVNFHLSVAR